MIGPIYLYACLDLSKVLAEKDVPIPQQLASLDKCRAFISINKHSHAEPNRNNL